MPPRLTIVSPSFNQGRFLEETSGLEERWNHDFDHDLYIRCYSPATPATTYRFRSLLIGYMM
jgi:hypothetical protein